MITNVNPKKAPGHDRITGKMIKELPKKCISLLTSIFNAILRLGHFPNQWKVSHIVVANKSGKPEHEIASCRPISLLPIPSKLFEKLFRSRLEPILTDLDVIPEHQFGFREHHSTLQQVHRLVKYVRSGLEEERYRSAVFLDVKQAFDKVWHDGLRYKLKKLLPHPYFTVLQSYLTDSKFKIKFQDIITPAYNIHSGVPQGSVLGPIPYLIYTSDIPTTPMVLTATFAEDTSVMASHKDPVEATKVLQQDLDNISNWLKNWNIQVNEKKCNHVTFTLRERTCPPVTMNNTVIPQSDSVKYLGIILDRRMTWKKHIQTKRNQLRFKVKELYWLIGNRSKLKMENKLLLYKTILKPVWTYDIQLWGTASNSNIEIIQRFQYKTLRDICNAPRYVPNDVIHRDLTITLIKCEITRLSKRHISQLTYHQNQLASKVIVELSF